MEVNIQIQCTAKVLNQGDGAGVRRLASEPRLPDQVRGNHTVDNTQHPAHDRRTAGQQEPQRIWKAQHPLSHRLFRQDLIDQQGRTLSAMRRAPQLGQKPRRLQLNATRCSVWQLSQRTRRKPCSRRPHLR